MSEFQGQAKSLAQKYVYYNYLEKNYPTLYQYTRRAFFRIRGQASQHSKNSEFLRNMAKQEAQKEERLLQTVFNANITVDLSDDDSITNLIGTINNYMNLKDVYNRNIELIKKTEGQKSVISWFPTYFNKALDNGDYINKIKKELSNVELKDFEKEAERIMTFYLEQAVEEGTRLMLDGPEMENTRIEGDYKNAYQQLLDAVGKVSDSDSLSRQLYGIYQLDDIKKVILEEMSGAATKKEKKSQISKTKIKDAVKKSINRRGGYTLEAVEHAIQSIIAEMTKDNDNVEIAEAIHIGQLGFKADNALLFNIDSNTVEETLKSGGSISRERNVSIFNELGNKIKNIENGFIVYTSDKNYTFNSGFRSRGGFSAGTDMTAEQYESLFSNIEKNIDTFVGAMMQLGEGAIGESREQAFERIIAQNIAYLLFDDFDTIGDSSSNAIHIMNLNGVLIPISFILQALANAIDDVESNPESIVKVDIKAPAILFKDFDEERKWVENNSPGNYRAAWEHQKDYALKNTKIATHFLKDFKQLITKYTKKI